MGFVIMNNRGVRERRKDGTITPYFEFAKQAQNYIERQLGDSPYLRVKEV
jgi:hypothetical protein